MIPVVETSLSLVDWLGTALARLGVIRSSYLVSPGLYAVGGPDENAPVLVTANYKLSFDTLRLNLQNRDCWILVLDSCGINVWCAAGKGTFSTQELIDRVQETELARVVEHRKLTLPQLGATGVASHLVKEGCGFRVSYGPVRASDLPRFLDAGNVADSKMRQVTFTLRERTVLIPVELYLLQKVLWWIIPILFFISGFGPGLYSWQQALTRGGVAVLATLLGVIGGAILVPILLPLLPGRSFAFKGVLTGIPSGWVLLVLFGIELVSFEAAAILLWTTAVSSYLGMNFTGSTPYTSPSGVEWEMKRAIPLQVFGAVLSMILWLIIPFI